MKKAAQFAMLGSALAIGMVQTYGAAAAKTNWTQNVNITLTAWQDGQAKPVAINNKSIVEALVGAAGSRLLVIDSGSASSKFVLRSGKVDTDVTSHFTITRTNTISSPTGATTTRHSLNTFQFASTSLNFSVGGVTRETRSPVSKGGRDVTRSLVAKVGGKGTVSGTAVLVE